MKKYLNINFILGITLCLLGFYQLSNNNDLYIIDFIAGFVNLLVFYFDNKWNGNNAK